MDTGHVSLYEFPKTCQNSLKALAAWHWQHGIGPTSPKPNGRLHQWAVCKNVHPFNEEVLQTYCFRNIFANVKRKNCWVEGPVQPTVSHSHILNPQLDTSLTSGLCHAQLCSSIRRRCLRLSSHRGGCCWYHENPTKTSNRWRENYDGGNTAVRWLTDY